MGIEPTRTAPPELENKQFGAIADAKCDWRVNCRGMWGHAGLRRDTSVGEIRRSSLPGVASCRPTGHPAGEDDCRTADVRAASSTLNAALV